MTTLVRRSDVGEFRRRYRWMVLAVLVTFLIIIGRLVQLQVLEVDLHRATARANIVREEGLATARGVVRDARGRVLATNRPAYNVYVVPAKLDLEKTWPRVAQLMALGGAERAELEQRIADAAAGPRRNQQILLRMDVDRDAVAALETHETELAGIDVVSEPVRSYPNGELGAHLVGYMRAMDAEALARLEGRGYRAGDQIGAVGVERRWESYLRGQRGFSKAIYKRGRRVTSAELEARYLEPPTRVDAIPGRDVSLTVDLELMRSIDRAMRGQLAGAVVAVDVRTGRLLAALSKPSYDPNVVSGGSGRRLVGETMRRLYADPLKPTLDKTISAAYPPGSTYKPFSALVGLADRLITPSTRVLCRGGWEYGRRYHRCTGVHGNVNLHEAIVRSCNTYFYALGAAASIDRLAQVGMDFGFGVKTGIGVNPEASGRMPTRAWYTRRYRGFLGGYTLLAAIGQGASTVTVLQLALAYAALANGGTLYQPQVVRSIETSDGTVVQEFPPRVRRVLELDRSSVGRIRAGLEGVVTEREGTAHAERLEGVDLAGKTGTAQVSHVTPRGVDPDKVWYFNRDHAWFAGYAPAASPEIAIVVLIEHGGGGGKNAVPVAMRVVRDWQAIRFGPVEADGGRERRP
ncbi:MAG: penicillin-binding protein 2 [Polyangiaceae bacterium]|nr:penicillin-binding protein 2 [Polyangiaceae bacterium]